MTQLPEDLITPAAAAKLISVSVSTIHRWRERGELRGFRVGACRFRYSRRDVLAMVEEFEANEPVRTAGQDEEAAAAAMARMRAAGRKV